MVHPTLLLVFPSARSLVEPLYAVWEKRLGPKALALERAQPQAWRKEFWRLLNQGRLLTLRARGFPPDPAPTLVVVASPLDGELEATLAELETFFLGAGSQGLEARLHLVLLLRNQEEFRAAGRFPPDPNHPLPSRVWPLALWNRQGEHLAREEYLQVWVQYFVEALLHTNAPLQPTRGRDWMGLGIACMKRSQPQAHDLVPGLWEAIKGAGEGYSPTLSLPPPPGRPSEARYPPKPERQDCLHYPEWQGSLWERALQALSQEEEAALEEALLSLENPIRFSGVDQALCQGPKALEATLTALRGAQAELQSKRQAVLAELDEGLGLRGQRARYRRLKARKDQGRPVDTEEFNRLEALFQGLDGLLEEGRLDALLEKDGEAQIIQNKLNDLKAELAEGQEAWNKQEAVPPPPPRGLRGFWERFRPRPTASETPSSRKRLCDEAWSILGEAHELHVAYAARLAKYRRIYLEISYLNALLPALAEEERQLQETLERIQSFSPRPPSRTHNPLVVRLTGPRPPRSAYRQEAARLLQDGILEHLWYGDDREALEEELLEGAERLLAHTPPPEPLNPSPEAWALLVKAATPQVPVRTWPEHRVYAYVLGSAQGQRWGEPYAEEPGREGEVVLFRLLYPLTAEDLWREGAEPFPEEGEEVSAPEASSQGDAPTDALRPNSLLDELQGLLR
mgnify:CR=1 FL=1